MQRGFAALVAMFVVVVLAGPVIAGPTIDAGAADAGLPDAGGPDGGAVDGGAVPDGGAPDAAPADSGFFPPALDDGEDCGCAAGGSPGAGGALLAFGVALALRRRR